MRGVFVGFGVLGFIGAISASCDPNMALVGTPCVPPNEDDPSFSGFDPYESSVFAPAADLAKGAITCMAYHFRGRVTCPYGQDPTGAQLPTVDGATGGPFPPGVGPCKTPSGDLVTGDPTINPGAQVEPQCVDRPPARTVTWTCRCANADGRTDDGAVYCACPGDTVCVPLAPCSDLCLTDAFCVRKDADFDPFRACLVPCDPSTTTCS